MKNGEGKSQNSDLCSTSSPEAGGWQTQKAIEEPRVLQVAEHNWILGRARI